MRLGMGLALGLVLALGCDDGPRRIDLVVDSGVVDAGDDAGQDAGPGVDSGLVVETGETCGNGFDDNGDGVVDDGCSCEQGSAQVCYPGDPSVAGVGVCTWGTQTCGEGVEFGSFGACTGWVAPGEESCAAGGDEDCDGLVDEGCAEGCPSGEPECEGDVVARALELGAGRVFVWGDEHVRHYSTYGDVIDAFWENAFGWLTHGTSGAIASLHVNLNGRVRDVATALGHSVSSLSSPTAADLADYDVLVVSYSSSLAPIDGLRAWVEAGGSVMVLAVGAGTEECDFINAFLAEIPLYIGCESPTPRGPVTELLPHALTDGLALENVPWVNGRWVFEEEGAGSFVVAKVTN